MQVDFDQSDGFVLAGLRSGRIPILLPGDEETLTWNIIPMQCGYARVPKITVIDRRIPPGSTPDAVPEGEGEPVPVLDIRHDERSERDANIPRAHPSEPGRTSLDIPAIRKNVGPVVVMVLP